MEEYIKNNILISNCEKKDALKLIKNRGKKYVSPESDKQIMTIMKYSKEENDYEFVKLFLELMKFVDKKILRNELIKKLDKEKDSDIYKFIKENHHKLKNNINKDLCSRKEYINNLISLKTKNIAKKYNLNINNFLDYGCGFCKYTEYFGKSLGLTNNNIYGCDIGDWGPYHKGREKKLKFNFKFLEVGKRLPFDDNFFSVILIQFVLHHIKDLDFYLKEINRICQMGGLVILIEHDIWTDIDHMIVDIEHMIYGYVYDNIYEPSYAHYRNRLEWNYLMKKNGLNYIEGDYISGGVNLEIEPNRRYYAIYKKVG
jgi:ubiquinone/menaquinone biosynthesis C-methylase UbiE